MKIANLTQKDIARLLPPRPARSNKGTFGRVLTVCGSSGMSGAAYLCALAAYRTGCGLVEILTPGENRIILQTMLPEAVLTCYDSASPDNNVIASAVSRADAVAVGCGMGQTSISSEILETVLTAAGSPIVIDADALNIISKKPDLWELIRVPAIITPHPVEMSRLSGLPLETILSDTAGTAASFAGQKDVVCILKDHNTVTTDGNLTYINTTGNSGMATGGSGDVLSGIIAGILAQRKNGRLTLLEAAALGVYIHGLAGDAAAAELGEYSMMASDIISRLPRVLKNF